MEEARIPEPFELLDFVQDALFVVAEDGKLLHASAGCQDLLGYLPAELIGSNSLEHACPEDGGLTPSRLWQVVEGEPTARFRNRWLHKDGHPVAIEWTANWSQQHRVRVAIARSVEA